MTTLPQRPPASPALSPTVSASAGAGQLARAVHAAAVAVVLATGLGLSLLFLLAGLRSVGLAWPVTHPEGALAATVLRVRDGEPLYQEFRQYPYLIAPYPPLQPVLAGLLSRLLGLANLETIALARSLTLAASLAAALLVGLAARACGAGRLAALAGAGLLLPLPFLDEWGFAIRPDLPALALQLAALVVLLRRPDRPWLAAAVAVLAFFTKQTAVAMPVAASVWLLLTGRWRAAALFAGAWLGLAGAGLALLELVTGGTYVLNTVLAHAATPKNGFDLVARDILPLVTDGWLPVGLALAMTILALLRRRPSLPVLYFLTAVALALVTLRNTGSDVNYLIEPAAAACILAGLAIDGLWWLRAGGAWGRAGGAALLAGAAVLWGQGPLAFWPADGGVDPIERLPLAEIAAADTVLSEEPLAVLLAGKPLVVSDTFHLSQLTTAGFFDPYDLEQWIKRSEIDLVVLRSDVRAARWWKRQRLFPETLRLAIKDNYVPAGRVGIYWLYRPEERRPSGR